MIKEYTIQISCLECGRDEGGQRYLEVGKTIAIGCDTCRDEVGNFTPTTGNYHDGYHGNKLLVVIEISSRVHLRSMFTKARAMHH